MPLDSPLACFALAISPLVTLIFVSAGWFKREPASRPSIAAAIPLCLTSIAILLGRSAVVLIETFNKIATGETAGLRSVVSGILRVQRPLAWGFADFGVCLIVLLSFMVFLKYSRDDESPLLHAYVALPALIVTATAVAALFLLVYLQASTLDLVMMIVDTHRIHELASRFGTVAPAYFARRISTQLLAVAFLSFSVFCTLIVTGVTSLFWRQKQNSRQAFAVVLTLGALLGCGISVLNELGFVDYLLRVH
jgi:hypothetical protein